MMHVSFDIVQDFTPRVPKNRVPGEDAVTNRICVAPTITDCLMAIPYGGNVVKAMELLGLPVIVHAYYFTGADALPAEEVQKLVPDAKYTGEAWITSKPEKVYRIDWELTNIAYKERDDAKAPDGKRYLVYACDKKRVRFQDNWENFAKIIIGRDDAGKFIKRKPDVLFRTFMQNMDRQMADMILERR